MRFPVSGHARFSTLTLAPPLSTHLPEAPDAVEALVVLCAAVLLACRATTPITVVVGRRPVFTMLWMVVFADVAEWNGHGMNPLVGMCCSTMCQVNKRSCMERSFTGKGPKRQHRALPRSAARAEGGAAERVAALSGAVHAWNARCGAHPIRGCVFVTRRG